MKDSFIKLDHISALALAERAIEGIKTERERRKAQLFERLEQYAKAFEGAPWWKKWAMKRPGGHPVIHDQHSWEMACIAGAKWEILAESILEAEESTEVYLSFHDYDYLKEWASQ